MESSFTLINKSTSTNHFLIWCHVPHLKIQHGTLDMWFSFQQSCATETLSQRQCSLSTCNNAWVVSKDFSWGYSQWYVIKLFFKNYVGKTRSNIKEISHMFRFQVSTGETRSVIFYWHIIHWIYHWTNHNRSKTLQLCTTFFYLNLKMFYEVANYWRQWRL